MEMQDYSTAVATGDEDQDDLDLDVTPDSSSAGVREWLNRLPHLFMARQILLTLGVVGRYQYIATNASAKEASVLVKTQGGLFSVLKSIDATSLMLQSFQSGARNILEKLKVAYLYLLDGFPDFAKTDIDAIAKDVQTMKESTEKALGVVKKTVTGIEEAHRLVSAKNGRERQLATIQQSVDQLNDQYRMLNEVTMGGLDGKATIDLKKNSEQVASPTFFVFLKINTIGFLKDPVCLLITVAILISFYVCACHFYNAIGGWVTMIVGMTLFLLRFALWKLVQPKRVDYKPVIPLILIGLIVILFPCQLLLPCESKCFVVVILAPPSTILMLFLWYNLAPEHWFFKVEDLKNKSIISYNSVSTKGSTESLQEQRQRIKDELLVKSGEKQRIEESIGDTDLTKCFIGKALSDLKSVTGIMQQCTVVIEKWYKECKDIIEPSMNRTIQMAQEVPEGELKDYWNSMAFKKEVVDYYCRWRALQVYCETLRSECREKRATVESHYVENLYPRDAVKRAWELADEEVADTEVAQLVRWKKEMMKYLDLSKHVNRGKEVKLDMSQ
ncbi:uncharacterized protein LOC135498207 [Lineus longissimus]|uniref:uncharacterized protein LOC135498207 n=1 Tax=Lineus longissimus TaxID=88925 RepID=UPI00315C9F14